MLGKPIPRDKKADQTLAQRAQIHGETYTMCLEEVPKVRSLVSLEVSDEDKLAQLLTDIAEDVNHFVITNEDLSSAADVMRHSRAVEALMTGRIVAKLGEVSGVATFGSIETGSSQDGAMIFQKTITEELGPLFRKASLSSGYRPFIEADSTHY